MKPLLFALCVVFAFGGLSGQTPALRPSPGHTQLPIWPGAVPDPQPVAGPEVTTLSSGKDGLIAGRPVVGVFNVTRPTMTVYSPLGNNTGAAVVVFPGGGYQGLAIDFAPVENGDLPAPAVGKIHVAPVVTLGPTPALWKKRRFVVTAGAAAFLIVAALVAWRLFSSRPALTGTDVILLASFVNKTGDPIFDNSLDKALEVKLTESPFLSVLPDADVRRTMRTMRHEPSERVTQELGIEICKRQGLKAAVVLATTSSLEGLQAYRTGQTLFRSGKQREAIPFLDPQFCSAYGALGTAYYSVSDDQASRKNFTKAYELKDARRCGAMGIESILVGNLQILQ